MPYPRRDPVPEEEMSVMATRAEMRRARWKGHHTLCETIREIYALTPHADIKLKCRMAMAYAKAMHERLKWYRARYDSEDHENDHEWLPPDPDTPPEEAEKPHTEESQ